MNYSGIAKKDVLDALRLVKIPGGSKNIVAGGAVQNIVLFKGEIILDITISTPALHHRKKLESEITKAIHDRVSEKVAIKVHIKVSTPEKKQEIKGKPISGIRNIIAIASGKGGVGKSTIAANIAVSLAKMGFKTGILDADIYGPSIPLMYDAVEKKPLSISVEGKAKMLPVERYGVKILSIGFFAKSNQAVVWRGPMASKALRQLIFDAHWDDLDFLILDLPPGTGDIHLSLVQAVPVTGAVIVSTPQFVALADARKGVAMFTMDAINVPVLGIVENMAYFTPEEFPSKKYHIFGEKGAANLAADIDVPFLGEIPLVQSIREAGDVGRPAALQENTPSAHAFKELTKNMVASLIQRNKTLSPTEAVKIKTMAGCAAVKTK